MPLGATAIRRHPVGVAAVAAIALAVGCGGGDDGPLDPDEFRAQANAICRNADRQLDAIPEPQSPDDFAESLALALPLQEAQIDELRDLTPPDELAERYGDALDLLSEQVAIGQQALDDIEGGGDPSGVITTLGPELEASDRRLADLAADLGLTDCAEDAGTSVDTTGATGDRQQYLADVSAAAGALVSFGETLEDVSSPEELEMHSDAAQTELDEFDSAIARLGGYALEEPRLEKQRAEIVAAADDVSETLRRLADAASSSELAAVQDLIPDATAALTEFQMAAQSGAP